MTQAISHAHFDASYFIKSYPQLDKHFGSLHISRIIGRLEYWFQYPKHKYGFYKFLEPSPHYLYKTGQSWQDELGVCRVTFNKFFDLIGTRYKSKTAFKAEADPFKGKLYASYFNRQTRTMFYVRNHAHADTFLQSLFKRTIKAPPVNKPEVKDKKPDESSKFSGNDNNFRSRGGTIGGNNNKVSRTTLHSSLAAPANDEALKAGEEMKKIWLQEIGSCNIKAVSLALAKRMVKFLKESLSHCLERWRAYCRKIASSKFLMGEAKNTKFIAWLNWAATPAALERIEGGEFTLGDREARKKDEKDFEAIAEESIALQPIPEAQAFHRHLLHQSGAVKYHNWFKALKMTGYDDQTLHLHVPQGYPVSLLRSWYNPVLLEAGKAVFPWLKKVEVSQVNVDNSGE